MSAIVTGSEGILGKKIVEHLSKTTTVYSADIVEKVADRYINLKTGTLDESLDTCAELYLFHGLSRISQCNVDPELAVEQNILANIRIFEKIKLLKNNINIIVASSIYAESSFGGMYSITKNALELIALHYAKSFDLNVIVVRIGSVYGDLFDTNSLPVQLLRGHAPARMLNRSMRREYLYIDDVVKTLSTLIDRSTGIYRLRGGRSYTVDDVVRITGYEGSLEFMSDCCTDAYIEIADDTDAEDISVPATFSLRDRLNGIKNQTYFFDFDGTIFDSAKIKLTSFLEFFDSHNALTQDSIDYLKDQEGMPRKLKIEKLAQLINGEFNVLLQEFDEFLKEKLLDAQPVDGALKYLHKLHSLGIRVFVISAAPKQEVKRILEQYSVFQLIDEVHCSVQNKAELVKTLIEQSGIDVEYSCYFGDTVADLRAADVNGIKYINVGSSLGSQNFIEGYDEL